MTRAGRTLERMPARAVTPEGREQRERILRAAIELFTAHGFRGASLDRVAAAVGISRQGVLHYFPSKTHLLLGVLDLRDEETAAQAGERAEEGTSFGANLLALVEHNQRNPDMTRLFTVLAGESAAPEHPGNERFRERYRMVRDGLAQGVRESGEFDPSLDDTVVATLIAAVMDGLQLQFLLEPGAVDMVEPMRKLLELLGGVIGPDSGDGNR
jgi:AcrR family transcriptional regulator